MHAIRFDRYEWAGGCEAMLRFGPDGGPTVVAALPLFEEANRTRASLVAVLRRLAGMGIGGALPELPGTGESPVATERASLAGWRAAFAAAASALAEPVHAVTLRGGALIDADAAVASRWRLSPSSGADTMRELRRVRAVSGGELYAGNRLSDALVAELDRAAAPNTSPLRTVRLVDDPRPADARLPGRPLWRGAEPGTDRALEEAVARDIAGWIETCGG